MLFALATLDKLRKVDTPTVCNLVELFDVRPRNLGYMDILRARVARGKSQITNHKSQITNRK